uniref:Cytochrome c oxidase subunit 3 n=1 Tax=Platygaster sp. ZJUH_2016029 TaxID=2496284 RepID=A0A3S8V177_9HYME|nr:cytochrome c oxidase subunit 3 [Platygaster sp. ZJUH_2016029]
MKNMFHPFHLVTWSPWPFLISISLMNIMMSMILKMNFNLSIYMWMSMTTLLLCSYQWWRDVIRESTFQGFHNKYITLHLNKGMLMFIISEILFFFSFFWSFFHMMLSPSINIGSNWPPKSINIFNPFNIPLLNTIILLSSGMFITWSHYSIMNNNFNKSLLSIKSTILLGLIFTFFQYTEYKNSMYSINDSSFGTTFFITTGFHGIHVIIGTFFIIISFKRLKSTHFSFNHHFGFEASAWYWHFVDVIWLFLFTFMYWWPF